MSEIMQYFKFSHLQNAALRDISQQVSQLAQDMNGQLPNCAEKSAGLRKLLEAKDCFVRAGLGME